MAEAAAAPAQGIKQRADIDDIHKWNLADIFESDEAWESAYNKAKETVAAASQFQGKLSESPETLYRCLKTQNDLALDIFCLVQYAYLNRDLDNRVSRFQELSERSARLSSESAAAFSFVEPELLEIEETKLRDMAAKFPVTDEFDFYINELIRSRNHVRSAEVEEVLAQASMVTRGADSIFTMLNDADLVYPSVKDEDGNEIKLTKQRFMKIMESTNRKIRKEAHDKFYSVYKAHVNTTGASLAASINSDVFVSNARRYESCLHAALDHGNIPTDVYHRLIENTESDLGGLHNYMSLRKRILGIDKVFSYDLINPLFPDRDYEVPYDQAVETILEALAPLGEKYIEKLKEAFSSRWVDVYETEGKGSGAYSWGNYRVHPFVLMNYNETVDNMFTLAHEMGHAMHSHLSSSTQHYAKAQYSIFVAEVASTLNEGLLLQHLLKKAVDNQDKLYLLNRHVDNTLGTFFNQVMYCNFEHQIHDHVEKGGALSPDVMSGIWSDLTARYFGSEFEVDDMTPMKWSRVPHFYNAYYVYQYATSYAASQAILDKFLAGEEGIVDKYLTLLSSGGRNYPIELLKGCGVDMMQPDAVKATIRLFGDQVKQMNEMAP